MRLAVFACCVALVAAANPLSWLSQYSLFIHNDMAMHNVDCQGRAAVGNMANLTNYEVGTKTPDNCNVYDLVVGNVLDFNSGEIAHGKAAYGNCQDSHIAGVGVAHCTQPVCQKGIVDFKTAFAGMTEESKRYAAEKPTGTATKTYSVLVLSGQENINYFSIDSALLESVSNITFDIKSNSWAIVNVAGSVNSLNDKLMIHDQANTLRKTLWNFYETTSLKISGTSIQGSVLATAAKVTFENGNIDGSLACEDLEGNGETHFYPWIPIHPCPPCPPCPPRVLLPKYNVFVHNVVDLANVDDQGRFAAGGPANLTNYAVATELPAKFKDDNTLVVGTDLYFHGGEVTEGNIVYGGKADIVGVTHPGAIKHEGGVIDFDSEFDKLEKLSAEIASQPSNGHMSKPNPNTVVLTCTPNKDQISYFKVPLSSAVTQIEIKCASTEHAMVNIEGTSIKDLSMILSGGITRERVLYNSRENDITLTGLSVEGSILAPSAAVHFTNGNIQGQLLCKSLDGDGEAHYFPFVPIPKPCPPCPPCPPSTSP